MTSARSPENGGFLAFCRFATSSGKKSSPPPNLIPSKSVGSSFKSRWRLNFSGLGPKFGWRYVEFSFFSLEGGSIQPDATLLFLGACVGDLLFFVWVVWRKKNKRKSGWVFFFVWVGDFVKVNWLAWGCLGWFKDEIVQFSRLNALAVDIDACFGVGYPGYLSKMP